MRTRILYLLACAGLLAGCGSEAAEPQPALSPEAVSEPPVATLGVSVLTLTHPFFLNLIEGLEYEAGRRGLAVELVSCEFDVARQQNQIADFIVRGVDALLLSPCDSKSVGTSIRAANEAGIPVFTFDIASLADVGEVVTHVGIDNMQGGRLAAEAALEALGGEGQIAIIDHPEVESVIQRTRGFREVIAQARDDGADVQIVSVLPGGGAQDKSFRAAEDLLQAHPDLDLIFGINDETALGAVAAIERAGRSGTVQVIGFGGKQEAREAVRDGRLYADVITHPRRIGELIVEAVDGYMRGEAIPTQRLIPTQLYTRADAAADTTLAAPS